MYGAKQYQKIGVSTAILESDPHRIIQMLMAGVLDRIATAKGHMQRSNFFEKCQHINKAIDIIQGLKSSLNMDVEGDLSSQLDQLYDYMMTRLFDASQSNDPAILDEVAGLMRNIKEGWDGIPENVRQQYAQEMQEHIINYKE